MAFDKKAVHFGCGNIGRGFVGEFLHNSGYNIVFVDVMDAAIEFLESNPTYTVTEIGEDGDRVFTIDHYRVIDSRKNMDQVIHEIATADVVTCAVGVKIVPYIAEPVAKAIEARTLDYPLAVIACENAINATTTWRRFIEEKLSKVSKETLSSIDKKARFANSAIDRIVPEQPLFQKNVTIEKFHEWCVEQKPFENGGKKPDIRGVHYVDDLEPYIERKLYTVNTAHATAAYYGYNRKIPYIHEALQNKEINDIVRAALKETAKLIVDKHGISVQEQNDYVESIIKRISNPQLKDNVERVGRAPLRKIGPTERFLGPATQIIERGEKADALLGGFEMALRFWYDKDEEYEKLMEALKKPTGEEAIKEMYKTPQASDPDEVFRKFKEQHPSVYAQIVPIVEKVQKDVK